MSPGKLLLDERMAPFVIAHRAGSTPRGRRYAPLPQGVENGDTGKYPFASGLAAQLWGLHSESLALRLSGARPFNYRPMAALFARRRIVSASCKNCLVFSCSLRYFPDGSWVGSFTNSTLPW